MQEPPKELVNLLKSTCMTQESIDEAETDIMEHMDRVLLHSNGYSGINDGNIRDCYRLMEKLLETVRTFGGEMETAVINQAFAGFGSIIAAAMLDPKQIFLFTETVKGLGVGANFLGQSRVLTGVASDLVDTALKMGDPDFKPETSKPN